MNSPVLHTLEANSFRVEVREPDLLVQDLHLGWWARLGRPSAGANGVLSFVPLRAQEALADADAEVREADAATLLARLSQGLARPAPPFPVPPVSLVLASAWPYPVPPRNPSEVNDAVSATLLVATILAWKGGTLRGGELREVVAAVLGDRAAADAALDTALHRASGAILRSGHSPTAWWKMKADWADLGCGGAPTADEAIARPTLPRPQARG